MKCFNFIKNTLKIASEKDPTANKICYTLLSKIEQVWLSAFIPVVSSKRILQIIKAYAK